MSALFDDAERFGAHIVVGDTVRHVKDGTKDHVGPGTYSPGMTKSKEFGSIGVSSSKFSSMNPPTSPKSCEHQRYAHGSVVRDGVWFHASPSIAVGPGPGSYSPSIVSNKVGRGRTAKPSSGQVGRQAWDLRGSAGGVSLISVRDGYTVSSSMGNSSRMADFSHVALRNGMLLVHGTDDGHRANGIGPGTYHGMSNRQDPVTKRSYNIRAQTSQARREHSRSFSGTSSSAKAFLSRRSACIPHEAVAGRPDLHLISRHIMKPGDDRPVSPRSFSPHLRMFSPRSKFSQPFSPRGGRRCLSPASARVSLSSATIAANANARDRSNRGSLSPKRNRPRSPGPGDSSRGDVDLFSTWGHPQPQRAATVRRFVDRGCRSMSPPPTGARATGAKVARHGGHWEGRNAQGFMRNRDETRAVSTSPRRQKADRPSPSSSPRLHGHYREKNQTASPSGNGSRANDTGAVGGSSYTYDYFGLAGQRGAWLGLEVITAARADVGINSPKDTSLTVGAGGAGGAGGGGKGREERREGTPRSLLPEGGPAKGVCSPTKETRDDLQKYSGASNNTATAIHERPLLPSLPSGP